MVDKFSLNGRFRAARLSAAAFAGFVVAAAILVAAPLRAASYTWSVPSGNWSAASNWGGTLPTGSDTAYVVNGGTANVTLPGAACYNLYVDNGSALQMTGGSLTTTEYMGAFVGYSGMATFTQSGGINSGIGDAALYLGYNSGSNGTYILSGSGQISMAQYVGWSGTGTFSQSGGTNSGQIYVADYHDSGTYNLSGGYLSGGLDVGMNGSGVFNQSGGTCYAYVCVAFDYGSGTYNLSGGSLSVLSGEQVGLCGSGTFNQTGGTNSAGLMQLGFYDGSSGAYNLSGGLLVLSSLYGKSGCTFNISGGTFQASSSFTTVQPITLGASGGGAIFDTAGLTVTLSGALSGPGSLAKVDSGTLVLAAANGYAGTTTLGGGTLNLANAAALGGGGNITFNGGTLQYSASSSQDCSAQIVGSTAPIAIDTNGANVTYGSSLAGSNSGGLTKIGSGVLTLSAAETYRGPTVISGGVLKLQPAGIGIGIHFVGGNNGAAFAGTGGAVPISNWNNESGSSFSGVALSNNGGGNSGATFSLSGAGGAWGTGSTNQLLNGYVYVAGSNTMTLTVAGIPYAKYSLYAYVGDSSVGNQEEATINGTSYYFATEGGALRRLRANHQHEPGELSSGKLH